MAASQIPLTSQLVRQDDADFPIADGNDIAGVPGIYADAVLRDAAAINSPSLFKIGQLAYTQNDGLTSRLLSLSPLVWIPDSGASLSSANIWTASQNVAAVALTDAATISTNTALSNVFTVTIGGNRTLGNPTNLVAGGTYVWIITQDGTGSRTLAYGSAFTWPGGVAPSLSTAAAAVDMISAVYDGVKLRAVATLDLR